MGYDIISDIHGQADKLDALLGRLGCRDTPDGWCHPGRIAVFVREFIDRGPRRLGTVTRVRLMVEAGFARAGRVSHALNVMAWHTPDPEQPGRRVRADEQALRERGVSA